MRYSLALARLRPSARIYWRSADFPLSTCIANDNDSRRPRSPYPAETRGECRNRVSVWVDNLLIVPRRLPPPFLPHGLSFPRGSLAPGSFAAPVSGGHVATPTPDDRSSGSSANTLPPRFPDFHSGYRGKLALISRFTTPWRPTRHIERDETAFRYVQAPLDDVLLDSLSI